MHRRTLRLYSHLLLGNNALSTQGRYGPLSKHLSSSPALTTVKAPVTTARAKVQLGLKDPQEVLIPELRDDMTADKKPPLQSKPLSTKKEREEAPLPVDRRWQKEDPYPAVLEGDLLKAKSPAALLQLSESPVIILKHACLILSQIGQFALKDKALKYETLMTDPKFVRISNLVHRGDYSQTPQSLFLAFHGLQNLGVGPDSEIFRTLGGELKWAMRRCPVRVLARAIELFSKHERGVRGDTPEEKRAKEDVQQILNSAIENLQRRWVEVTTGPDFIAVFKILNFLNAETRGKLEDRAVDLAPTFFPVEMRKLFIVLGSHKRRPTPLLRALAFHLSKAGEQASGKDLIDLTYALNELTFSDPVLMQKVCSDLCSEVPTIENSALISSLLTSLGQMRYKHKGLLQIIDEWIMAHLDNLRPFDCATWLLTCAVLNYQPQEKDKFCTKAKSILTPNSLSNSSEWVNIVHALVILNEHSAELIASTLNPEVVKEIDNLGIKSSKTKVKLLNLNALAKNKSLVGYKGPFLDSKYEKQWSESHLGPSDPKLSAVVLESLGTFLPTGKYLKLNQKLESGVFVDAFCFLSERGDPLPVPSTAPHKKTTSIAIVVEGYSCMCRGIKDATGSSILNRNILQAEGFSVISVPYTEFNMSDKLIRRVQYLEQRIKSTVNIIPSEMSNR